MLHDPERIEVAPQGKTADRIEQKLYYVPMAAEAPAAGRAARRTRRMNRVIVFTRTKHGANRSPSIWPRTAIAAEAIHGNKSQNARQRALEAFRAGKARVLVATDIAARGIDIDDISHVVNFELPNEPESYVHRIGRTARAGERGIAISFCDPVGARTICATSKSLSATRSRYWPMICRRCRRARPSRRIVRARSRRLQGRKRRTGRARIGTGTKTRAGMRPDRRIRMEHRPEKVRRPRRAGGGFSSGRATMESIGQKKCGGPEGPAAVFRPAV